MTIRKKEPELIEAQAAAFLESDYVPGELSYQGMANVAKNLIAFADDETHLNEIIDTTSPRAGDFDAKQLKSAYVGFLREQNEFDREERRQLAPYIAQYETFRKSVEVMPRDNYSLLGEGVFSKAYGFEFRDDEYAVRVPKGLNTPVLNQVHKHLRACMKVADLPHVERLVAASYVDGITISELAKGEEVSDLSTTDIREITVEHIIDLKNALETALERGVTFDPVGANLFFEPANGFTAIDLGIARHESEDQDPGTVAIAIKAALLRGLEGVVAPLKTTNVRAADFLTDELNKKISQALMV